MTQRYKKEHEMMMDLIIHQMSHVERNYLLHYHVADGYEKFDRRMGLLLVVLSVLVTASIGLALVESDAIEKTTVLLIGLLSLSVSVLTSVMTFLNHKEKSLSHSRAGENYYYLQARIRSFLGSPQLPEVTDDELLKRQTGFVEEIRQLQLDSPTVPGWAYKNSDKVISSYQSTSDKVKEHQGKWLDQWFNHPVKANKSSQKDASKADASA